MVDQDNPQDAGMSYQARIEARNKAVAPEYAHIGMQRTSYDFPWARYSTQDFYLPEVAHVFGYHPLPEPVPPTNTREPYGFRILTLGSANKDTQQVEMGQTYEFDEEGYRIKGSIVINHNEGPSYSLSFEEPFPGALHRSSVSIQMTPSHGNVVMIGPVPLESTNPEYTRIRGSALAEASSAIEEITTGLQRTLQRQDLTQQERDLLNEWAHVYETFTQQFNTSLNEVRLVAVQKILQ